MSTEAIVISVVGSIVGVVATAVGGALSVGAAFERIKTLKDAVDEANRDRARLWSEMNQHRVNWSEFMVDINRKVSAVEASVQTQNLKLDIIMRTLRCNTEIDNG